MYRNVGELNSLQRALGGIADQTDEQRRKRQDVQQFISHEAASVLKTELQA